MIKTIAALMLTSVLCSIATAGSVIKNGDFEQVSKRAKATDQYILKQIKRGWDLGAGPLVELPKHWLVNGGKGKLRVITVGANGENKENVHSGKHALYFESRGAHYRNTAKGFKPGKYELKFWAKGEGTLVFTCYYYGPKPETGSTKFVPLGGRNQYILKTDTQGQWKEYKKTVMIGTEKKGVKACALAIFGWPSCKYYLDDISLTPVK